jgi:hypothetical protein
VTGRLSLQDGPTLAEARLGVAKGAGWTYPSGMLPARPAVLRARSMLAAVTAGLFGLVTWRSVQPDYVVHARWARELAEKGLIQVPHPLFHVLTAAVHSLLPLRLADRVRPGLAAAWVDGSYVFAALVVGTASTVALALLLHRHILKEAPDRGTGAGAWASAGWALALLLVAPITVLTWPAHQLYLGYVAPNVFHSPTVALLKPLALAWFWTVSRPGREGGRAWVAAALLAAGATLAKPSFTVAVVPALGLWLALARWLPRAVDTRAALASLVVGGVTLVGQAWARGAQPALLGFEPLEVMGYYSARWQMPLFLLLSIAFPLCVAAARWPASRRQGPLMLAWLVFGIAAAYGYLLAEAEPNTGDGNWLWSGQVALFVLFAESVLFFRSRGRYDSPPARRWRRACAAVFALHLACGLAWYAAEVVQPHGWWFPFPASDQ